MEQIIIPQNHPHHSEIKSLIGILLSIIDADSVYVSSVNNGQQTKTLICLILKKETSEKTDELYGIIKELLEHYPRYICKIFDAERTAYSFRKGNLFFICHCSVRELVYRATPSSPIFNPTVTEIDQVVQKAKKHHIKECEQIHAVSRDLAMFIRNGNHLQAAYILHETIWELYHCASWFLAGISISSKSIIQQQSHISDYSCLLGTLFEIYDEDDANLLQELNSACDAVCQNFDIPISRGIIPNATAKAEFLKQEIKRLFEENMQICKDKFSQPMINNERAGEEPKEPAYEDESIIQILITISDRLLECLKMLNEMFLDNQKENAI